MDQERSEVREVEEARRRVADDVRSVAYNANVVDRAKENIQGRIDDMKGGVTDRLGDMRDRVGDGVEGMRDRVSDVRDSLQERMQGMARNIPLRGDNPIGMLLAGMAIGFLVGLLLPVTQFENERLGPVADEMKDRVRQARSEVVRRGGEVIKETIEAARETATTSLREQSREVMGGGSSDQPE
ncbi:MAG TPA: hypothetical protein VFA29_04085 [Candidatus Baltobacteraceae bacterium]|nr:hypothetical protein [Candidatus Baltobacteraceae bacterium]